MSEAYVEQLGWLRMYGTDTTSIARNSNLTNGTHT
jgi:hypothetical protein